MSHILDGLEGVVCQIDDVLVYGQDQKSHDSRLRAVLSRLDGAGVTLNSKKCSFNQRELTFLGHVINKDGISADPEKIKAIKMMKPPSSIAEMRRFLGMVNQFGKFSHNLATITQPL